MNEKQINAQIDSMMKNDEIQACIMGGFVTKKAAELFPGLEEGAPTNEALNQYLTRQLQVAEGSGRYWDSLAQSYGADYGSNSVARDQMDKNYDIGLKEIALNREQMEKNYDIDLRKLAQKQQQIELKMNSHTNHHLYPAFQANIHHLPNIQYTYNYLKYIHKVA